MELIGSGVGVVIKLVLYLLNELCIEQFAIQVKNITSIVIFMLAERKQLNGCIIFASYLLSVVGKVL